MSGTDGFIIPIQVVPDYDANAVVIVCTVLMFFSLVTVGLRFYTRLFIVRSLGSDDIFILLSWITCSCFTLLLSVLAQAVSSKSTLTGIEMTRVTNMLIGVEAFYVTSIALLKVSLAQFFLRILVAPWQRYIIFTTLIVFTSFSAAYFFYAIFQCGVPQGSSFWLKKVTNQCAAESVGVGMGYTHAILTALSDLIFVCLPILVVRQSAMRHKEKMIVIGIMVIATVGWIASLVRIKWVPNLWKTGTDYFVNGINLAIWSAVEPSLGIIASSIATLRPLYRKVSKTWSLRSGNTTLVSSDATDHMKSEDFDRKNPNIRFPMSDSPLQMQPLGRSITKTTAVTLKQSVNKMHPFTRPSADLSGDTPTDGAYRTTEEGGYRLSAAQSKGKDSRDGGVWAHGETQMQGMRRREEELGRGRGRRKPSKPKEREGMPLGIYTTHASNGNSDSDSFEDAEEGVRTGWYSNEKLSEHGEA